VHHRTNLLARESSFEARSESVEGIGSHRVETAVPIKREWEVFHARAAALENARRSREWEIDRRRENLTRDVPRSMRKSRNRAPKKV
jgi:hypothetical protein